MDNNAWTDNGVALLRKLWAEGATAAVIGRRLGGVSRSAVLGKVFRLRLNGEVSATTRQNVARKQTASESAALVRRRSPQPRKRITAPPANAAGPKTLLELTNDTCRSGNCAAARMRIARSGTGGTPRIAPPSPR